MSIKVLTNDTEETDIFMVQKLTSNISFGGCSLIYIQFDCALTHSNKGGELKKTSLKKGNHRY